MAQNKKTCFKETKINATAKREREKEGKIGSCKRSIMENLVSWFIKMTKMKTKAGCDCRVFFASILNLFLNLIFLIFFVKKF